MKTLKVIISEDEAFPVYYLDVESEDSYNYGVLAEITEEEYQEWEELLQKYSLLQYKWRKMFKEGELLWDSRLED